MSITEVFTLFGGLGFFLYGMKLMSEGLEKAAGAKMRGILEFFTQNRFIGMVVGIVFTVIIQSSNATTVMVVSFVNSGLMTLMQATGVILGANIGTTVTGQLIAFNLSDIAPLVVIIGVIMVMFSNKQNVNVKKIGEVILGFGILFMGLRIMGESMEAVKSSPAVLEFLSSLKSPFSAILVGFLITAVLQSSSATVGIILLMVSQGLLAFTICPFMILGCNIGSCVSALAAGLSGKKDAKRAALIHFLFNVFGAIIFAVILLAWKGFAATLLDPVFPVKEAIPMRVALFHTIFNVVGTLVFIPFINLFVKLANLLVRDKNKGEEALPELALSELDERLLNTPSVALGHLFNETGEIFSYAMKTLDLSFEAFLKKDIETKEKVIERNEELSLANKKVVSYLIKLSASPLTIDEEKTVSSLHYVLNYIMRISELADNVTKYTGHYVNDKLVFSQEFLAGLEGMFDKIKNLYELSRDAFLNRDVAKLEEVDIQEDAIDKDRRKLVSTHIERLNEGKCQPQNSSVFINLVGNLERAADHITYIAHSIEQSSEGKEIPA